MATQYAYIPRTHEEAYATLVAPWTSSGGSGWTTINGVYQVSEAFESGNSLVQNINIYAPPSNMPYSITEPPDYYTLLAYCQEGDFDTNAPAAKEAMQEMEGVVFFNTAEACLTYINNILYPNP